MRSEMRKSERKWPVSNRVIYFFMGLLAVFMHFYKLGSVPYGLHIDEAGMAYDAFCLANYSVDRYLNHLPVYLTNFGGGQSALYGYLTAGLIKLTGMLNPWIIRLPGALIGMLGYFSGIGIVRKCLGEKWGLLTSFFMAIFPYFIMQSRFGLDCNLLLGISIFGVWMLLRAEEKKKTCYFVLAGIVWGICYYTYALGYIGSTLFLGSLLVYWLYHKKITWKQAFCFGIPILLMVWPLVLMLIINSLGMEKVVIGPFTVPRLPEYRGGELTLDDVWGRFRTVWKSILTRDNLSYNALDHFYTMYVISIPFAVIGAIKMIVDMIKDIIRHRYSAWHPFVLWFCSWLLVGSITGGTGPNINRLNGMFFALLFCVLYGMRYILEAFRNWLYNGTIKKGRIKKALLSINCLDKKIQGIVLLAYFCCFFFFAGYYFIKYPKDIYPQTLFADTCEDIIEFVEREREETTAVYMDASHIYYLLSIKADPYEVNLTETRPETYGKYTFYLPDEIDENAVYIVRETNTEYCARLQEMSFDVYHSGMYNCYY